MRVPSDGVGGVGQRPVAAQRPCRLRRDVRSLDRHAADLDDSSHQHRYAAELADSGHAGDGVIEVGALVVADVEEEECRHGLRQPLTDLSAQVGVDQGDRDQHRQAGAERDEHRRRR